MGSTGTLKGSTGTTGTLKGSTGTLKGSTWNHTGFYWNLKVFYLESKWVLKRVLLWGQPNNAFRFYIAPYSKSVQQYYQ